MEVNDQMGKITKRDKESIVQLVLDCTTYNFTEHESLEYIGKRFAKQISGRTYRRYKRGLESGNGIKKWMNHYNTVGVAVEFQNVLNTAKHLLESSMRRLLVEENKEIQNDILILRLKEDIRQDIDLIMKLSDSSPVISATRDLIERFKTKAEQNEQERLMLPEGVRLCP